MFEDFIEAVGKTTDLAGVAVIVVGVVAAAALSTRDLLHSEAKDADRSEGDVPWRRRRSREQA